MRHGLLPLSHAHTARGARHHLPLSHSNTNCHPRTITGTDYADLCGEPHFMDLMLLRHGDAAREAGAMVISACAFDSVPADIGALYAASRLEASAECRRVRPPASLLRIVRTLRFRGGGGGGGVFALCWSECDDASLCRSGCPRREEEARRCVCGMRRVVARSPTQRAGMVATHIQTPTATLTSQAWCTPWTGSVCRGAASTL